MDKNIFEKQKEPLMVQCLFAQRSLYQKAKMVSAINFCVTVVLICIVAVVQSFIEAEWLTGLSVGLSVAACFVPYYVNFLKNKFKTDAANIQQYFDVTLYSFSEFENQNKRWHCPITKNQVIEKVSGYHTTGFAKNDIWYEDYSSKEPWEQIYFCQCENIRWDGNLRRKYKITCNIVLYILLVVVVVLAFAINPSLHQIVSVLPWGLPFIKYLFDFNKAMKADERRIEELKTKTKEIDNDDHISYSTTWVEKEIELQTLIYEHRKKAVLIPTLFYILHRSNQQKVEENIVTAQKRENYNDINK